MSGRSAKRSKPLQSTDPCAQFLATGNVDELSAICQGESNDATPLVEFPPPHASLTSDILAVRPENGAMMSISQLNVLLHNFGIEAPELKARLSSVFVFVFEQGVGGLFDSLNALITHMGYAVNQRLRFDQDRLYWTSENERLQGIVAQQYAEIVELRRIKEVETAEIDAKKGELDELIRQHAERADRLDGLDSAEISRLTDENSYLQGEVNRLDAAVGEKNILIDGQKQTIAKGEAIIQEKTHEVDRVVSQCSSLESQVYELKKESKQIIDRELEIMRVAMAQANLEKNHAMNEMVPVQKMKSKEGVFYDPVSFATAVCPVLLCTGCVLSYKTIIDMWAAGPGRNDGEITRSVKCAVSGMQTCVSSKLEMEFVQKVAAATGMNMKLPLVFEYTKMPSGEWTAFGVYDQVFIFFAFAGVNLFL